jgi:hypothetical protein
MSLKASDAAAVQSIRINYGSECLQIRGESFHTRVDLHCVKVSSCKTKFCQGGETGAGNDFRVQFSRGRMGCSRVEGDVCEQKNKQKICKGHHCVDYSCRISFWHQVKDWVYVWSRLKFVSY